MTKINNFGTWRSYITVILHFDITVETISNVYFIFFQIILQVKQKREAIQQKQQSKSKEREHNRTTVMLIAVVLSFGIAELPQGILVLACTGNDWFFKEVYRYLGDILDTITLFNTSFNFVLYTTMSQKFRDTFYIKLIRPVKRILPCVNKQYQDVRQTDEDWQLTKNASKQLSKSIDINSTDDLCENVLGIYRNTEYIQCLCMSGNFMHLAHNLSFDSNKDECK